MVDGVLDGLADQVIGGVQDWATGKLLQLVWYVFFWPITLYDPLREAGCPSPFVGWLALTMQWFWLLLVIRFIIRRFQPGATYASKPGDIK